MNEDAEQQQIDAYFEGSDLSSIKPLQEALNDYLVETEVSPNKLRNVREILFAQTVNGTLYRGFITVTFWNWNHGRVDRHRLGNCLYITHVMISPRGGNIIDVALKELNNPKINSIYIESIMAEEVIESFVRKGWTRDGENVYLKKTLAENEN